MSRNSIPSTMQTFLRHVEIGRRSWPVPRCDRIARQHDQRLVGSVCLDISASSTGDRPGRPPWPVPRCCQAPAGTNQSSIRQSMLQPFETPFSVSASAISCCAVMATALPLLTTSAYGLPNQIARPRPEASILLERAAAADLLDG